MQRFFSILMLILFLLIGVNVPFAKGNDIYTVENISIDIQAENPTAARDMAIERAQLDAFAILVKRLFPFENEETFSTLDKDIVFGFVRDFSLHHERHSATRYLADFTIRFDEGKVSNFFDEKGVDVSDTRKKRILVIPVLQMGQRLLIWEDPNPWRDAWKVVEFNSSRNTSSVIVPAGDIMDLRLVPGGEVFAKGKAMKPAFLELMNRYGADEIFFALLKSNGAAMSPADGVDVILYRYNLEGMNYEGFAPIMVAGDGDYELAIEKTVAFLNGGWERQLAERLQQMKNSIEVRFPIRTLRDWIVVKEKLASIKMISNLDVVQLNKNFVDLKFDYMGDYNVLVMELNGLDMELSFKNGGALNSKAPVYVLRSTGYN